MSDPNLNMMTAIILAGIVSGEGTTNDDRAMRRAAVLAEKLSDLLAERLLAKQTKPAAAVPPTPA